MGIGLKGRGALFPAAPARLFPAPLPVDGRRGRNSVAVRRLQRTVAPKVLVIPVVPLSVPLPLVPLPPIPLSISIAFPGIAVVVRSPPLQPLPMLHRPPRVSVVPAVSPPVPLGVLGTLLVGVFLRGFVEGVPVGRGVAERRRGRRGLRLRLFFRGEILEHLLARGARWVEVALEMLPHHRLSVQDVHALFCRTDLMNIGVKVSKKPSHST